MSSEVRARAARPFLPPRPTAFGLWVLRTFGGLYNRIVRGVSDLRVENIDTLLRAYREFSEGASKLLVLFRHVNVADGPVVMTAVTQKLHRYARRRKVRLARKPHVQFLYGRDVLNWTGPGARWIFPRLGGIPVTNTRLDRQSHTAIRETITHGEYPLALAPEGQVTYQMYHVSELAAGTGTMARWIEQDLYRLEGDNSSAGITLLPLAIGYDYSQDPGSLIDESVHAIETELGMRVPRGEDVRETLLNATDLIVSALESLYDTWYPDERDLGNTAATPLSSEPGVRETVLSERLEHLCDLILRRAEATTGGNASESALRRLFDLRYKIMDMRFRPDSDPDTLPAALRSWADHQARRAGVLERHAQLVDILMYVRPMYIPQNAGAHRLMEYALNLRDVLNRLKGGNVNTRFAPKRTRARVLVGEPIDGRAILRSHPESPRTAIYTMNETVHEALRALSWELEDRMSSDEHS